LIFRRFFFRGNRFSAEFFLKLPPSTLAGFDLATHISQSPRRQAETIPLDLAASAFSSEFLCSNIRETFAENYFGEEISSEKSPLGLLNSNLEML
jgi:hypothetical protein